MASWFENWRPPWSKRAIRSLKRSFDACNLSVRKGPRATVRLEARVRAPLCRRLTASQPSCTVNTKDFSCKLWGQ